MPIYEYRCDACGEQMEKLQRMSDDKLVDCPACGKPALKRLVSAAAFRLKGGGWYETDFKKDNKRNLVDGSSPAGNSSGTTSESGSKSDSSSATSTDTTKKADTKPAAKPAAKADSA